MKKLLALFFNLLLTVSLLAQETATEETPKEQPKPFGVSELRQAGEETQKTLDAAFKLATDTAAINNLDTALINLKATNPYRISDDSLAVDYEGMTLWLLKNEARFWRDYLSDVTTILDKVNDRYDDLSEYLSELGKLEIRWKLTQNMADTTDLPENIEESIQNYTEKTTQVRGAINGYLDMLGVVKTRVDGEINQVNRVRSEIETLTNEQAKSIFSQDAQPLFKALSDDNVNFIRVFKLGLANDIAELKSFIKENSGGITYHIIVTLLLALILFAMRLHFFRQGLDKLDEYATATTVYRMPVLSGLIVGIIFSGFFYDDNPRVFVDALVVASIVPAVILMPRFLHQRFKFFAYFLILVVFTYIIGNIMSASPSEQRLMVLISSLIGIAGFVYALLPRSPMHRALIERKLKFFLSIIGVLTALLLLSVVFNLRGSYQLSLLISGGVVHSLVVGIAVFISVNVIKSFLAVIIGTGFYGRINILLRRKDDAKKWFLGAVNVFGVYFWLRAVLSGFALLNPFLDAYTEFLEKSWTFGEVTLSMNNIVDFVGVLLIFWLISNVVNLIIKDEIFTRIDVRKGLPLAIGVLSRYFILFLGFVLAMAAAGISLSKLSILLGALGVGIGFGLQNIVSNLVSGLVIIFERPIHIGDVVSSDTIEGEVIDIGLRSSRVRTWEGAEVIVPNNNLVANEITNWTYSDKRRRVERMVYVENGPNPREVKMVIDNVIANQDGLLKMDQAQGYFLGTENNALKFRVLMWMDDNILQNPSEVLLNLYDAMLANGMKPYIPVQRVIVSKEESVQHKNQVIGNKQEENSESKDSDKIEDGKTN
jgi:potassium efflux system protein